MDDRGTKTLAITPGGRRRTYLLNDGRESVGSLQIARSLTAGGEIRMAEGHWAIARDSKQWWAVDAGDPGSR